MTAAYFLTEVRRMLTKRLAACAELVTGKGIACDVGTDHAYLAAELLRTGRCKRVIASDIGKGPLQAAERTLKQAGLLEQAQLILSDGLRQIPSGGVTDVVIAGMGGETIIHIVSDCDWVKQGINLILQPMTKVPLLRTWLAENGYQFVQEKIVQEGRFFYTVMQVRYDGTGAVLDPFVQELGDVDWTDETVRAYGRFRLNHYQQLAEQMMQVQPEVAKAYQELAETLKEKCGKQEETA